jgi:hypothetical protein
MMKMGGTARAFARVAVGAALVAGSIALTTGVAQAHHPEIVAGAECDTATGTAVVSYTATAWAGMGGDPTNDPGRENNRVDIAFDGVVVATGQFVAPTYSFSGSAPAPAGKVAGDSVLVTATAVGRWGNSVDGGQVASVSVTIPTDGCVFNPAIGRFTGGGSQVRVGEARVTRGLTIHCDLLLSNNLEINWGGNKFHMTEHLTTVACTDDPAIIQAPPPAPLDTLIGVGTGRYNNANGYTVEFTIVDYGEPGSNDRMAIRVYQTSNPANVVLNVPLQTLSGGNLQAHYDQPHK